MKIEESVTIKAPIEQIFEFATDIERWPSAIKGIVRTEKLTPGPVAVGTRFKETRVMMGRESTEEMTFTQIDPPKSYTLEADSCGAHYRSVFQIVPEGESCRLTLSFEGTSISFIAKITAPLLGWMMAGTLRKCLKGDLEEIKRALESSS